MATVPVWTTTRPKAERVWYIKVRHLDTGAEIQRLFSNGTTSESEAVSDMWRYLQDVGRATEGAKDWTVVQVARWS